MQLLYIIFANTYHISFFVTFKNLSIRLVLFAINFVEFQRNIDFDTLNICNRWQRNVRLNSLVAGHRAVNSCLLKKKAIEKQCQVSATTMFRESLENKWKYWTSTKHIYGE